MNKINTLIGWSLLKKPSRGCQKILSKTSWLKFQNLSNWTNHHHSVWTKSLESSMTSPVKISMRIASRSLCKWVNRSWNNIKMLLRRSQASKRDQQESIIETLKVSKVNHTLMLLRRFNQFLRICNKPKKTPSHSVRKLQRLSNNLTSSSEDQSESYISSWSPLKVKPLTKSLMFTRPKTKPLPASNSLLMA